MTILLKKILRKVRCTKNLIFQKNSADYVLIPFIFMGTVYGGNTWARSLKSTADRLGTQTRDIGFGLALFGICLGGIYLIVGKQDAPTKIINTIVGIVLLSSSASIINFIKGVA